MGEENIAHGELARRGQIDAEFSFGDFVEKAVGQGHQYAGSVAGVCLEAAASAVVHAGIQVIGIQHDLMAGLALYICNESNAAGIFFLRWVIESCLCRIPKLQRDAIFVAHSH